MVRADLICNLIENGLGGNMTNFRRVAEAICVEERSKRHGVLADKISKILTTNFPYTQPKGGINTLPNGGQNFCQEKFPERTLNSLFLPQPVLAECKKLIEEQHQYELLLSHGLNPRNRLLLIGPPGNGKTSLAEAIADALYLPLYTVKYESIVGSYLGETANKLSKLFDFIRSRRCVLFFDEFETLGKERGDIHETGEIKRVVSSLLLQIDSLPNYVTVIAATNHEELLDRAVWRRFQIRLNMPNPTQKQLESYFSAFETNNNFKFGCNISTIAKVLRGACFADAEEFALSVYRQYVLSNKSENVEKITQSQIEYYKSQTLVEIKEG